MTYNVNLEIFEGPMDLLLYLIKKNDLDINDVKISSITEEYLKYIELMKMLNIELAGEFMVMAATLMHIKSKKLLPQHEHEEETIEDLEENLRQKLIEYKKFKEVAKLLKDKEDQFINFHYRETAAFDKEAVDCDMEATMFDLVDAFKKAYERISKENVREIVGETITVEEKMEDILRKLLIVEYINISELFNSTTKIELIVTFLATLELIRLKKISVLQNALFGDIRVYKRKPESFDEIEPLFESDEKEEDITETVS